MRTSGTGSRTCTCAPQVWANAHAYLRYGLAHMPVIHLHIVLPPRRRRAAMEAASFADGIHCIRIVCVCVCVCVFVYVYTVALTVYIHELRGWSRLHTRTVTVENSRKSSV